MAANYQPQYRHVDWIDNVDRVQAGGGHGFNLEFGQIETEFSIIASALSSELTLPGLLWGNRSRLTPDQGGSLELGADGSVAGTGTPYIDFHFKNGRAEDFSARIINDADHQLTVVGALQTTGSFTVDAFAANNGNALMAGLNFGGLLSGEGISSTRQAGQNQFGLDLWTGGAPRLTVDNVGRVGIGVRLPRFPLHVSGTVSAGGYTFGNQSQLTGDQGGAIELGATNGVAGTGTPYIDFHFRGKTEDFNARIINDSDGHLTIVGSLDVTGHKNFRIDHPVDPEHKYLLHGCLEGPEHGVIYRGCATLADGSATVALPDYFEALTREENRTVILTPLAEPGERVSALAASRVRGGAFSVRAIDAANPLQAFYWEVKAERADAPRLRPETDKAAYHHVPAMTGAGAR